MKRLGIWLLSLLVIASLASLQALTDRASARTIAETRMAVFTNEQPLIPSLPILRLLSFNQEPLLADLLWLNMIQYFGSGSPYGTYPALGPFTERITDLDPRFASPYEFGQTVLPFMGQAETAERLGLKAREQLPENGFLTYLLATVYHLNIRDYKKAAEYYELAADLPGTPTAARQLAAVARRDEEQSQSRNREAAKIYWRDAIERARNDDELDRASRWLAHMEIVDSLEIAARQFKAKHNRFPATLEELKESGEISSVPTSPIYRKFVLEADGTINFEQAAE